MKKCARAALAFVAFGWGCQVLAAEPACTYHEEPDDAAPVSKDSVTLLAVDPPDGAEVRKDTVLVADVQFRIAKFEPKKYFLEPMFLTAGFGSMSPAGPGDTAMLEHASGTVHLCVRLQEVYDHPAMAWPLSMRIQMLKVTDGRNVDSAGFSSQVKFKSSDAPADRRPDEYYDSLKHASSYFDNRLLLYKLCIAHYPATQPAFTKAYRAWEGRHRADIELAAELQFENYKNMVGGRTDQATTVLDGVAAASRKYYEDLPAAALKHECDMKLSEMADPDDTTNIVVGDEMAVLRKYSKRTAEKPK